jgi:hypothetical protein
MRKSWQRIRKRLKNLRLGRRKLKSRRTKRSSNSKIKLMLSRTKNTRKLWTIPKTQFNRKEMSSRKTRKRRKHSNMSTLSVSLNSHRKNPHLKQKWAMQMKMTPIGSSSKISNPLEKLRVPMQAIKMTNRIVMTFSHN